MTTGTPSGVVSAGSLAGGSTGGGWSGNVSVAAAVIRLVLPTPSSPTTQMCTVAGAPAAAMAPHAQRRACGVDRRRRRR